MTRHETALDRPKLRVVNHVPGEPPRAPLLRPHALFPREPKSGPEDRDIRFVGIQRQLSPAAAKKAGHKIEHCPRDFPADELADWAAVHELFGGGAYKVCAKDCNRRILCWEPGGNREWYVMGGRTKPLSEEEEDEQDAPALPPTRGPAAPPAMDVGTPMLVVVKMQQEAMVLQMQMMTKIMDGYTQMMTRMSEGQTALILAILNRPEPRAATAPPPPDLLEAVKLGAEIVKAAQPAAPPPPADPLAQMRGTIALVKDLQAVAPAADGSSDMAQMGTMMSKFVTDLKARSATQEAAPPAQAPQQPPIVFINGRGLTLEAAAEEYSRLMAGPPLLPSAISVPAAFLAPAAATPPPVAPLLIPAAALPPPAVDRTLVEWGSGRWLTQEQALAAFSHLMAGPPPPADPAAPAPAPLLAAQAPPLLAPPTAAPPA